MAQQLTELTKTVIIDGYNYTTNNYRGVTGCIEVTNGRGLAVASFDIRLDVVNFEVDYTGVTNLFPNDIEAVKWLHPEIYGAMVPEIDDEGCY